MPATHRLASVLPLLTLQQLTVWQLYVGGILGSLFGDFVLCCFVEFLSDLPARHDSKEVSIPNLEVYIIPEFLQLALAIFRRLSAVST